MTATDGISAGQAMTSVPESTVEVVHEAISEGRITRQVGDAYLATLGAAVEQHSAFSVWIGFEVAASKRED